ncbi:Protein kinase-like domain containing protein, partial [Trema orientale]
AQNLRFWHSKNFRRRTNTRTDQESYWNIAWKLWNEGNPLELLDKPMEGSFSANEVIRCIKVGLLCVQQRVEDRPTMSSVLFMLGNENSTVPEPKEPGFSTEVSFLGTDTSSSGKNPHTANSMTVTLLDGR